MNNMHKLLIGAVLAVPMLANAQQAQNSHTAQVLADLHHTNQMEIEMGTLASTKAATGDVKDYANKLVSQHRDADQQVVDVAAQENVKLDAKPATKGSAMMSRLQKLDDRAFDREFLKHMVEGHDKAIAMVKKAESSTKDDTLRALLTKLLPSLEEHRDTARKLLTQVNAK